MMLATGLNIPEAILRAALTCDPEIRQMAAVAAGPMAAGMPLYRALMPWKERLPEIVLPVLEVGEMSGTLESACRRLASAFGHGAQIERRIRYSVFDPRIVLLVLVLNQVAHGLAPSLSAMLTEAFWTLIKYIGLYLAGRLIARVLFRWQPLRLLVDTTKLALPQVGTVFRNLAIARWARSFVTLWNSGVPVSEALEVSARTALNAHYEQALQKAAIGTRQGISLHDSLAQTALLPSYLLDILATAETSGNIGSALDRFVTLLEEQALASASQTFVTVLIAGQIVLWVAALAATGGMGR
jgi:type IV pilus assembly protein PilC